MWSIQIVDFWWLCIPDVAHCLAWLATSSAWTKCPVNWAYGSCSKWAECCTLHVVQRLAHLSYSDKVAQQHGYMAAAQCKVSAAALLSAECWPHCLAQMSHLTCLYTVWTQMSCWQLLKVSWALQPYVRPLACTVGTIMHVHHVQSIGFMAAAECQLCAAALISLHCFAQFAHLVAMHTVKQSLDGSWKIAMCCRVVWRACTAYTRRIIVDDEGGTRIADAWSAAYR